MLTNAKADMYKLMVRKYCTAQSAVVMFDHERVPIEAAADKEDFVN